MKKLVLALAFASILSAMSSTFVAVQAQEKECPEGQIYNPETDKCEKAE